MTLKSRNRLFLLFFIISLICSLIYAGLYIYAFVKGGITPPENPLRPLRIYGDKKLFTYSFIASLFGIAVFVLYVPVVTFVLLTGFEKTQSIEIMYFSGFLLASFTEGFRILLPLFGLWKTYTTLFIFSSRIVFAGRILAPLSLLFAAIFSETEQRQNVERNYIVLLVVAILFGMLAPLDTMSIVSTCTVLWGYAPLFNTIRLLMFILTLITTLVNAFTKDSMELKENAAGFAFLMSGYSLLLACDNYLILFLGTGLFAFGTVLYLKSIHTLYLWR